MGKIWDEKPLTFTGYSSSAEVCPVYHAEKMDAFHEKLKAHYKPIEEKVENHDELQERYTDLHGMTQEWGKKLGDARNNLYKELPTGDIDAFALLKVVQSHINELDAILEAESSYSEEVKT